MKLSRQFIFRHYWWIAPVGGAMCVALVLICGSGHRQGLIATVIATAGGFAYFAQQQKLAEMRLFKDLFTEFNRRYDDLNDHLARISGRLKKGEQLEEADELKVTEYFNLCAEEYLFQSEGYIHDEAWRTWCNGMWDHFHNFRDLWERERAQCPNSYYGFCLDAVEQGAKRKQTHRKDTSLLESPSSAGAGSAACTDGRRSNPDSTDV